MVSKANLLSSVTRSHDVSYNNEHRVTTCHDEHDRELCMLEKGVVKLASDMTAAAAETLESKLYPKDPAL
jgi:hypothetical protein